VVPALGIILLYLSKLARTLRLLGEIAARAEPGETETAENQYREALALADELSLRPLVAHCHLESASSTGA
jgi:Na+-transporting methylmalonyl-CoA/oxaloacetate decarboxylase gamma subunit